MSQINPSSSFQNAKITNHNVDCSNLFRRQWIQAHWPKNVGCHKQIERVVY